MKLPRFISRNAKPVFRSIETAFKLCPVYKKFSDSQFLRRRMSGVEAQTDGSGGLSKFRELVS